MANVEVKSSSSAKGGVGFAGLLTIVFIVLKLCHVIDWSWGMVLAPLWITVIIWLLIFALFLGACIWADRKDKKH